MANVFDAIQKHAAEQAQSAPPAPPEREEAQPPSPVQAALANEAKAPATPPAVQVSSNGYSAVLMACHDRGGPIAEQYRALRTHLLAQYADERFCLVVTSAEGGEGKTVSCLNLALVLAERLERKTIVVDGDLRRGQIAGLLKMDDSVGFADVLAGSKPLADAIQPTVYPNLFAMAGGHVEQNEVARLVGRPETTEIVAELRRRYDYVLIDTPPISAMSDAGMLGRATGEALLVVRMNKTSRESADRAIRLLNAANVKLVGLVLTHQKFYIPNYLYHYS